MSNAIIMLFFSVLALLFLNVLLILRGNLRSQFTNKKIIDKNILPIILFNLVWLVPVVSVEIQNIIPETIVILSISVVPIVLALCFMYTIFLELRR
jgi:hypothetical protein